MENILLTLAPILILAGIIFLIIKAVMRKNKKIADRLKIAFSRSWKFIESLIIKAGIGIIGKTQKECIVCGKKMGFSDAGRFVGGICEECFKKSPEERQRLIDERPRPESNTISSGTTRQRSGIAMKSEFNYTGQWPELFGVLFGYSLLTIITFGIYYSWAFCNIRKWVLEHTYAEGRQLTFMGRGTELFGILFVQILLTVVTFGIWSFLQIPIHKFLEFDIRNTKFKDSSV